MAQGKKKPKIFSKKVIKKQTGKALKKAGLKPTTKDETSKPAFKSGLATKAFAQSVDQTGKGPGTSGGPGRRGGGDMGGDELNMEYGEEATVDVKDELAVGSLVAGRCPLVKVDVRSIGGANYYELKKTNVVDKNSSNLLLNNKKDPKNKKNKKMAVDKKLVNECLLSMRVAKFEASGEKSTSTMATLRKGTKARGKLRYVCIIRSTNRPLADDADDDGGGASDDDDDDEEEDSEDDYDKMYAPESAVSGTGEPKKMSGTGTGQNKILKKKKSARARKTTRGRVAAEDEISSFPTLVLLALHADGATTDIRKILQLEQLATVEYVRNEDSRSQLYLTFSNKDTLTIDTALPGNDPDPNPKPLRKERFLWKLLQIHALLCTSVLERNTQLKSTNLLPTLTTKNIDRSELQYLSTVNDFLRDSPILFALLERQRRSQQAQMAANGGVGADGEEGKQEQEMAGMAYDMMMGNFSRYALFNSAEERQEAEEILNASPWRTVTEKDPTKTAMGGERTSSALNLSKLAATAAVSATADPATADDDPALIDKNLNIDPAATSEALISLLQKRMRDLEAETCRRLIAWEDEKDAAGNTARGGSNRGLRLVSGGSRRSFKGSKSSKKLFDDGETTSSSGELSLAHLLDTLDHLDRELESMENWLEEKNESIRPLTMDCREIEEENRQLERQFQSYETLGSEMKRILDGIDVDNAVKGVMNNPRKVLKETNEGNLALENDEGVQKIHRAGVALKTALERAEAEGGLHIRAVRERVEALITTAKKFCDALAGIFVEVMEQLAKSTLEDLENAKIAKTDKHGTMVKKLRDTQKKFQSSLLLYIKLVEILSYLKPDILPAIRAAYAALVEGGILSKKRMKTYFSSLPCSSSVNLPTAAIDLKDYHATTLVKSLVGFPHAEMKPVNSEDIDSALREMLPVIAREAYFTAALFGLTGKKLDGRDKKRNFEAAKSSVDTSSKWFRYYVSRICGIATEAGEDGKQMAGDPMLSLVASIYLNEYMEQYIDRQKKGGDHSLSLAYVRATIFDLRKKVDKQWVGWVESQITWIRSNHGVPLNGKRAGIFPSFARFPTYLDHILICVRTKNNPHYIPHLAKIKVISYYLQKIAGELFASLHECAVRETTDQQYAANVMRMENSYFFTQSISRRGTEFCALFQKQITAATAICKQSTDAYLGWMIKREFKQLHSMFSSISRIKKDVGDADVPIHVPKANFVKTLNKESNREVMREKIAAIYARMEKHLCEAGGLLPVAWKALVKVLYEWFGRWEKLSTQCYNFVLEPSAVDVVRIAKAAGGVGGRKYAVKDQSGGAGGGAGGTLSGAAPGASDDHHHHHSNGTNGGVSESRRQHHHSKKSGSNAAAAAHGNGAAGKEV